MIYLMNDQVTIFPGKLHWLPLQLAILFLNTAFLVFNALNFSPPPHLPTVINSSKLIYDNRLFVSRIHTHSQVGSQSLAQLWYHSS